MSRSFLRQATQISASVDFADALAAGLSLQSSSYTLEDDLNAVRSQLRRILYSTASNGKWYDDVPATAIGGPRGLFQLGGDLEDLERKRLVYRVQKNTVGLQVPIGQNYVTLSVGAGFAPGFVAAVSAGMTGSVVSLLSGSQYDVHSMELQSGSSALVPKNLVVVVSASTGNPIQSDNGQGFDIYALLQASGSVADGDTFDDVTKRVQLSFVKANPTRTGLVSASIADIEGRFIQYSYARRVALDEIPDDAYLDGVFVDVVADISATVAAALASLSASVSLDSAIDNQVGPATQTDRNIVVRISSPYQWSFANAGGTRHFLQVDTVNSGVSFDVDHFVVNNTATSTFLNSVRTNVSGNWVQLSAGQVQSSGTLLVNSATGSNLILSGGNFLVMADGNKQFSTFTSDFVLADSVSDWNQYVTSFGQVSLFDALQVLSQSITGAKGQLKATAVVTTKLNPDVNVTYPTNLDAPLLNYSAYPSASFVSGVNVYLNGQLQRGAANGGENHDVYPGVSPATGDLRFEFKLEIGDVITMIIPN